MRKLLKVQEARAGDSLMGIARMHPDDMAELSISEGELIEITGEKQLSEMRERIEELESAVSDLEAEIEELREE